MTTPTDHHSSIGARPVEIRQAGAAPGSQPQRSPNPATGGPSQTIEELLTTAEFVDAAGLRV